MPFEGFVASDFEKVTLSQGESFTFPEEAFVKDAVVKIELTWKSRLLPKPVDLDLAAIMLDKNGYVNCIEDLVYFNSMHRWKTDEPIGSPEFNAVNGRVSNREDENCSLAEWFEDTLPLSLDGAVIGSWDDRGDEEADNDGFVESEERMHVIFRKFNPRYSKIAIITSVAMEDLHLFKFKDVFAPVVRVLDAVNDRVLAEYALNAQFGEFNGVCLGYLEFDGMSCKFVAGDKGYNGGMMAIANSFVRR